MLDKNLDFTFKLAPLFDQFTRTCIVARRFDLSTEDVEYISAHKTDFKGFDFNAFTTVHLQSISSFVTFRASLPETTTMHQVFMISYTFQGPIESNHHLGRQTDEVYF